MLCTNGTAKTLSTTSGAKAVVHTLTSAIKLLPTKNYSAKPTPSMLYILYSLNRIRESLKRSLTVFRQLTASLSFSIQSPRSPLHSFFGTTSRCDPQLGEVVNPTQPSLTQEAALFTSLDFLERCTSTSSAFLLNLVLDTLAGLAIVNEPG